MDEINSPLKSPLKKGKKLDISAINENVSQNKRLSEIAEQAAAKKLPST